MIITLWELNGSSFDQTWIPYTQRCFVPNLVEIGPAVLEKKILNFVNVFWNSLFRNYLPLEKGKALDLNKLESSSPKDALCQVWLKLAQRFWRNRFLNFVNVFLLFRNYLPLEKGGPFICTKLNPHHPRMHCAKFGWNLTYGSGEEDF